MVLFSKDGEKDTEKMEKTDLKEMKNIRLIALDLDGTLLTTDKRLTERNRNALRAAAEAGIDIVPTTGRISSGMPDSVKQLDFVRFVIAANGAQIIDRTDGSTIFRAEIPWEEAYGIMEHLDTLPVIYDCYMDDLGYMSKEQWDRIEEFAPNEYYVTLQRSLCGTVPDLKELVRTSGKGIQKIKFFFKDMDLRARQLTELQERYPQLIVTSSIVNNIEINHPLANKGEAIRNLAAHLGLDISQTMAFGDGLNDISMIKEAGVGVAMANAWPEVAECADIITASCDEDGVAQVIEQLLQ